MRYLDRTTTDVVPTSDVYLRVTGSEPSLSGTGQAVDEQGRSGALTSSDARSTRTWERRPGPWVTLKGPERDDTPVELTTQVTVAPEGWVATSHHEIGSEGATLTVSDPSAATRALVVVLSPPSRPAPSTSHGSRTRGPSAPSMSRGAPRPSSRVHAAGTSGASLAGGSSVLMAPSDLTA